MEIEKVFVPDERAASFMARMTWAYFRRVDWIEASPQDKDFFMSQAKGILASLAALDEFRKREQTIDMIDVSGSGDGPIEERPKTYEWTGPVHLKVQKSGSRHGGFLPLNWLRLRPAASMSIFQNGLLLQVGSDFTLEEEGVLYFPLWSSGDKMTGYFGFEKAIIPGF
jgi:hypothetical protein